MPTGGDVLARAWRWIGEQIAFLAVLAVLLAAFVYLIVAPGHWVRGSAVIALALLLAAALRIFLPSERVGLLAVRGRWVDAGCFLVLGGAILGVDLRLHG